MASTFLPLGIPFETPPRLYDDQIVDKLKRLYQIARDAKRPRYDTWFRNYRLVHNRIGAAAANNSWMPAPRDSEIYPGLSSLVAWMTDQELFIDYIANSDPQSPTHAYIQHIADDLADVVHTTYVVEDYKSQIKMCLWDAFMYGTGILKASWDNSLAGGFGNAMLRRIDPYAVFVDPNASSFDDAEYIIEVRKMSYDELERRFPDTAHLVGDTPQSDSIDSAPKQFDDLGRQPKVNPGAVPQSGTITNPGSTSIGRWGTARDRRLVEPNPAYILYEFWLRENVERDDDYPELEFSEKRYDDKWRLVVVCNSQILLDVPCDELWSHGKHPYEDYRADDLGEFYGIALVDHLAYPQIYLNRLLTALQHNTELTGNPIFIEPTNAGSARVAIVNRPGLRLPVNSNSQQKPDWLQPPSMPTQVMDLINFYISRIENTLGLSALQKGIAPTQRNAEGALNMVQEAAFVRVRAALANLEKTLERAIGKITDLIIDNYTEPRMMAVIGDDGQMLTKRLAGNHFMVPTADGMSPLKYVMRVECGSDGATSRSARINEADRLYAMNVVDRKYVMQAHRIKNADAIEKRVIDQLAKGVLGGGARQKAGRSS